MRDTPPVSIPEQGTAPFARRGAGFAIWTLVVGVAFARPLGELFRNTAHSQLYSHILLVPFISLYLIWLQRHHLALDSRPVRAWAIIPLGLGIATLGLFRLAMRSTPQMEIFDYLAAMTFAFLCFIIAGAFVFLGQRMLRQIAFPLVLLFFMVPFPEAVKDRIDIFFQWTSAEVAYWFLTWSGMPVERAGLEFDLLGQRLKVAAECSGIHSSLVLFITSLIAGYLFLRSPWRRAALTAFVIPLAMMRNGFRIFTIGQLCVEVGEHILQGPIHKRGGPIFFVLSLIPFFLLLLFLRKSELRNRPDSSSEKP